MEGREAQPKVQKKPLLIGHVELELRSAGFIRGRDYQNIEIGKAQDDELYGGNHNAELRIEGIEVSAADGGWRGFYFNRDNPVFNGMRNAVLRALNIEEGWRYHSKNTTQLFFNQEIFPENPDRGNVVTELNQSFLDRTALNQQLKTEVVTMQEQTRTKATTTPEDPRIITDPRCNPVGWRKTAPQPQSSPLVEASFGTSSDSHPAEAANSATREIR